MKIASPLLLLGASLASAAAESGACGPDPLEWSQEIGMMAVEVGRIPTSSTAAWSYNMMPADNVRGPVLYFLEQLHGKIFSFEEGADPQTKEVFDIATSVFPDGLSFDWTGEGSAQTEKVHALTQGPGRGDAASVYVVLKSSTLPTGWTEADAKLPPPGAYPGWQCEGLNHTMDLYRIGLLPDCYSAGYGGRTTFTAYEVFTEFAVADDGRLVDPEPFFVQEMQISPGHMGGGILTVPKKKAKGKILWSVGDCLPFGNDGHYEPQFDEGICGKILLIDPKNKGKYDIVAKGVRNSQQFRHVKRPGKPRLLVFMDIGAATAEEVNVKGFNTITDTRKIENFGWGRSIVDGKAREGTFYIEPGFTGILGSEKCDAAAPPQEEGFISPWIQFGRTPEHPFYAISSFAIPPEGDRLSLIWTEFNTGLIMGTEEEYSAAGPSKGYKIVLYDAEGVALPNGCNDLVKAELGELEPPYYRGDPRLFHFPDGTAGVFIERTGVIYRLSELDVTLLD